MKHPAQDIRAALEPAEVTISIDRLDWFCAAAVIEQARHLSRQPLKRLNK